MFARWPLTIRGTGALVLAGACVVLAQRFGLAELLYLAILLVTLVGASIATLYLARSTEKVTRSFEPDVVAVGDDVTVRMRVDVRAALPSAQGRWADTVPAGLRGDGTGTVPATTSGIRSRGGAVELAYRAVAERRGIHPVGPLAIVSIDPFGLARRRRLVGRPSSLTVTPAAVELGPLVDQPGEDGGGTHAAADRLGQGADNLIPRHYTPGDSMRRIHWRASAHRDQLMVRQEEQETTPEAIVVLDRSAAHWSMDAVRAPGADAGFEVAVSACLSVAAQLVAEGYLVSVIDGDGAALCDPLDGGDLAGVERLAIDLAGVRARREGSLGGLLPALGGGSTGPLVVITGAIRIEEADGLAPVVHHSALPVLIAVAPHLELTRAGALARAAASGWRTAVAPVDGDLAAAWHDAVDRGIRHVGV
ncbi:MULTISPECIES: DUF58 domain-containing protein [unclassified Microbacterium]|uniref:DUF58 domain-containing protein n=1 Tax=unclassified Microbacterium TaxID=2609290 RepID=UPI003019E8DA